MAKRTQSITLKVSDKMKSQIDEYANAGNREINQEVVLLIAEAIAYRKAKPQDWY